MTEPVKKRRIAIGSRFYKKRGRLSLRSKQYGTALNEHISSLARFIEQSEEYRAFESAKIKLMKDKDAYALLSKFRRDYFNVQMAERAGENMMGEMQRLNDFYSCIYLEPLVGRYVEAEKRLMKLLVDVQEAFAGQLNLWSGFDLPWSADHERMN